MFDFGNNDDYSTGYSPAEESIVESLYNLVLGKQKPSGAPGLDSQTLRMTENQKPNYFKGLIQKEYDQAPTAQPGARFGAGTNLIDALRHRESGGNYKAINNLGYSGAYQFGAPALETIGYLKPGTGKMGNRALNNPANWTFQGGKEAFLNNPELQDEAVKKLMAANKRTLEKMGLIKKDTPRQKVNAMLAAAHLVGPGGVKDFLKGKDKRDAYGTSAKEYYNLGLKST